jgi:hypothetical protein
MIGYAAAWKIKTAIFVIVGFGIVKEYPRQTVP